MWAAPSAKNHAYRVSHWDDRCPDELSASFCLAVDAMADASSNLTLEREPFSIKSLRAAEEQYVRAGIHRHVTAALDDTGAVVGYTLAATVDGEPELAEVWNTVVLRAHRGRGLGLRLKAAATLRLRATQPKTQCINTFNNKSNGPMLRINRTMGYRGHTDWLTYEFPVTN